MLFKFNQLLRAGGVDPDGVRLVRHKPHHHHHRALFDAAMRNEDGFRHYQETQSDERVITQFRSAQHLAGFVVEPFTKQTVFVGVWELKGERTVTTGPFEPKPTSAHVAFRSRLVEEFEPYRGRVMIEWGEGERAWVQRADKQDKDIVELRPKPIELPFPGYAALRLRLDEVEKVPERWVDALRNVRGIYLLVHRDSDDQYVGSASGAEGFFGRWKGYADGHGGNVAMKELGAAAEDYDAAILEVMGSDATLDDILAREALWMKKLGTRAKGLNR